jgi:hypothetical protein
LDPSFVASERARLIDTWTRLGLGIRCGYNPGKPAVIRQYLGVGASLVRQGHLPAVEAYRRMLTLLIQSADDPGIPWFWRSVCLEHTALPAARLVSLLKHLDPAAAGRIEAAVGSAQALFPAIGQQA